MNNKDHNTEYAFKAGYYESALKNMDYRLLGNREFIALDQKTRDSIIQIVKSTCNTIIEEAQASLQSNI